LYRYNLFQDDQLSGTQRFSLLTGIIIPTANGRDLSAQAGFVYTLFFNRHELDLGALYQKDLNDWPDSGRYDVSWQYRLFPADYPDWGIANELYSVLELNGRWHEKDNMTHQVTAGLQLINQKFVIEGGIIKDINNEHDLRYVISTRFHF
jgi:hypothetical protein